MTRINTNNPDNPLQFEVRKVQQQTDGRSLSIVIPNRYSKRMGLHKGDLLKIYLDYGGKLLVSEKVDLSRSTIEEDGGGQ
jgi:antitoxin component of MazEF toxin-antitoxin module